MNKGKAFFYVVLSTLVFTGCKAPVNPDFRTFIIEQFNKNQALNFSTIRLTLAAPPQKINYAIGEEWLPGSEGGKGLAVMCTLGGGSEKYYAFHAYDPATKIITMRHADGATLLLKQEGFESESRGVRRALKLSVLNDDGEILLVPELPVSYNWRFENEGEPLCIEGSNESEQTRLLFYNVYEQRELETLWAISPGALPAVIKVNGEPAGTIDAITINGKNAADVQSKAYVGDTVTVTAKHLTGTEWRLKTFSYTENGTGINTVYSPFNEDMGESKRGTFMMPAYDTTISLQFEDATLAFITVDNTAAAGASFPAKMNYSIGETFDPAGICLKGVRIDNATVIDLTGEKNIMVNGTEAVTALSGAVEYRFIESGQQTVIVTARGKETAFTVNVSGDNAAAMRKAGNKILLYPDIASAMEAAAAGQPDTITLIKDVSIPEDEAPLSIPSGKNIILNAQGVKTIKRGSFSEPLVKVKAGTCLTLGSEAGTGGTLVIDGGAIWAGGTAPSQLPPGSGGAEFTASPAYGAANTAGGPSAGTLVQIEGGEFTLWNGAVLRNNDTSQAGGGVCISSGTFTMKGGIIEKCKTAASGGAVSVDASGGAGTAFSMLGGVLQHNAAVSGGAVFSDIVMNFSGGKIQKNYAGGGGGGGGGGIAIKAGGELIMTGGEILYNTVTGGDGGGLVFNSGGTARVSGGVISGNEALGGNGDGIYLPNGLSVFELKGSALIAQNNDICLAQDSKITLTGNLTGTAQAATITPSQYPSTPVYDTSNPSLVIGTAFLTPANLDKLAVTPPAAAPPWNSDGVWVWQLAGSSGHIPADTAYYGKLWVGAGASSGVVAVGGIENIDFTLIGTVSSSPVTIKPNNSSGFGIRASAAAALNTSPAPVWTAVLSGSGFTTPLTLTTVNGSVTATTADCQVTVPVAGNLPALPAWGTLVITFRNSIASYTANVPVLLLAP